MELTYVQRLTVKDWVKKGLSDEQIAQAMILSVKQVRPIRLAAEAEARPR